MQRFEKSASTPALTSAILLSTAAVFWADIVTPLGVAVWILYLIPLALCLYVWRPALPARAGGGGAQAQRGAAPPGRPRLATSSTRPPTIFQPFMQADHTLDRSKGGLGLALVRGLVELHGGSVRAHSDGLGRGAEFIVRLPLDTAPADAPQAAPGAARPPRCRVLIIEDNNDAADSLREALEFGEHQVRVAYNGPDGIATAREFLPEVVLCDMGLPGMSGYEVARAFRADAALKDVYLVALSGYALPEDLLRAREAGFARHLAKPPSLEKLRDLLAGVPRAS